MGRFAINPEGARAMRQLSNRILMCANEVVEANGVLERQILSLSQGLGIYEKPIEDIIAKNKNLLKQNYDSIMELAQKAAQKAAEIEMLTGFGGEEGPGGGWGPSGGTAGGAPGTAGVQAQAGPGGETGSPGLAPDRSSPRDLPCTAYGFHSDAAGNLVYDSPMGMDAYLYKKQGTAKMMYQGTCGLCSCANILRLSGVNATEKDILDYASRTKKQGSGEVLCEKGHLNPNCNGGTCPEDRKEILEHFGISSGLFDVAADHNGDPSDENIETIARYISEGRGVILSVHADILWRDVPYSSGMYHAVTVTSVKKDQDGRILGFYICDSAKGGTTFYPADKVRRAMTGSPMNVTYQIIR